MGECIVIMTPSCVKRVGRTEEMRARTQEGAAFKRTKGQKEEQGSTLSSPVPKWLDYIGKRL